MSGIHILPHVLVCQGYSLAVTSPNTCPYALKVIKNDVLSRTELIPMRYTEKLSAYK